MIIGMNAYNNVSKIKQRKEFDFENENLYGSLKTWHNF